MPARRFTDEQEQEICCRYEAGESSRQLAEVFNVTNVTIRNIYKRHGGDDHRTTKERHIAAIATHEHVELVGEYVTAGSFTLYRCCIHGETHRARPQHVQGGGKLRCCSSRRQQARERHIAEIAAYGKVELVGDYVSSGAKTAYRCIEHGEVHEVRPSHVRIGGTLLCCSSNRKKTQEEHAAALAKLGTVELVGEYIGTGAKTLYRCLKHGEKHLAWPSAALKGHGLKCCSRARRGENHSNFVSARDKYDRRIAKIGKVVRVGDYLGARKYTEHRCLIHGEVHPGLPTNLLRGHSLVCCRECGDSVDRALSGKGPFSEVRDCDFYIYDLTNFSGFVKPGISFDVAGRVQSSKGQYGEQHFSVTFSTRQEAYFFEQAVLDVTRGCAGCPEELLDWTGASEVRSMAPDDLIDVAERLLAELEEHGVWAFASLRVPMTMAQRAICQQRALAGAPAGVGVGAS